MPNLQSHQALFRAGNYTFDGYLSVVPKRILFSRAINQSTFADQLTSLTYDNPYSGAGVYTDVPEDAELVIYSGNTSTIKGRLRVAYGGASSSVIQVCEISQGRLALADNDRFEVWDEFRLRDKLVGATETFPKDSRREYTDEGTAPAPQIIVGGPRAGRVDATTALLTRTFDASSSYPIDPDNVGGLTYLWNVGDGTISVGTTTTSSITVTFPATSRAHRHVTLTLTDADNGKSTVRKIPVFSYDWTNTTPIHVKKVTYTLDRAGNSTSATFEMPPTGGDVDSMPEGCLVVYWEREYYNGVEVSYGNQETDCNNVKWVGYLRRETISINPDTDTLTFEAISPLGKLAEIAGFSQDLTTVDSPLTWAEDEDVNIRKLAWYVATYHTTIGVNFDLLYVGPLYTFNGFTVQQSALLAQMREVSAGISYTFTCDRTGRFILTRNLQRGTSAERSDALTTLALTTRDLLEIPSLVWEHSYQYNSLIGKFFTPAAEALLSVAPGEAPADAPEQTSFERGIAADQTEATYIANQYWAEINGLYNGLTVPQGATLKVRSTMDVVDPAYAEFLTLTLDANTNRRGRSFSTDRFILQRVEIACDGETGTKDITWTVDHETLGQGAVMRAVPDEASLPPYNPYPPAPSVPPRFRNGLIGARTLFAVNRDGNLYYCGPVLTGVGFDVAAADGGPLWVPVALPVGGRDILGYSFDAFCPAGLGTGSEVRYQITTDVTGYYVTHGELPGSVTLTRWLDTDSGLPFVNEDTLLAYTLVSERGTAGRALRTVRPGSGNAAFYTYTRDYLNWKVETAIPGSLEDDNGSWGAAWVSMMPNLMIASDGNHLYISTADTPSFSVLPASMDHSPAAEAVNGGQASGFHMPVGQEDIFYCGGAYEHSGVIWNRLWRGSLDELTMTELTPVIAGEKYGLVYDTSIQTSPTNADLVVAIVYHGFSLVNNTDPLKQAIVRSTDGGDTWTVMVGPTTFTSFDGLYTRLQLVDDDTAYFFGSAGAIGYCDDVFGAGVIDDRSGNLSGAGDFVGIYGA